jgi:hypothetical protein
MLKRLPLAVVLTAAVCGSAGPLPADEPAKPAELPAKVFGHWVHSREEDAGGVKVYRPSGYKFPPSRGRDGFEIKKGGEFIDHPIAPADGNESVAGTWKPEGEGKVVVTFKDEGRKALTFQVVSCDGKVLKIK